MSCETPPSRPVLRVLLRQPPLLSYTRLRYIEDDEHEVVWVRLRPQKLPRKYACIVIACIYHPPKADNGSRKEYMITSLYSIVRCYPECGIILTGDFNQPRDSLLRVHYEYAPLVNMATRNGAILDKIWSNMSPVYAHPAVLSELGSSDHRMVLLVLSSYPTFGPAEITLSVFYGMASVLLLIVLLEHVLNHQSAGCRLGTLEDFVYGQTKMAPFRDS